MKYQILNPKSQPGFTLLEVVVAMAIVGLGVVTLLQVFSQGLRLVAKSSAKSEAMANGREVLDEILSRQVVSEGREAGSLGRQNRWQADIRPVREEGQLSLSKAWELKEITLQMSTWEGASETKVAMKTLRLVKKKNP